MAAEKVIGHFGYGDASIELIAEEAGFSRGAFYANFCSKESIVFELFQLHRHRLASELDAMFKDDPEHLLTGVFRWLQKTYIDSESSLLIREFQLLACRDTEFSKQYGVFQREQACKLATLVRPCVRQSFSESAASTFKLADILIALVQGLQLRHLMTREGVSRGRATEAMDMFFQLVAVERTSTPQARTGNCLEHPSVVPCENKTQ